VSEQLVEKMAALRSLSFYSLFPFRNSAHELGNFFHSDRITASETNAQFAVVHDLARSLSSDVGPLPLFKKFFFPRKILVLFAKISDTELYPFVEIILNGLSDSEASSASGTCIVLNGALFCF